MSVVNLQLTQLMIYPDFHFLATNFGNRVGSGAIRLANSCKFVESDSQCLIQLVI